MTDPANRAMAFTHGRYLESMTSNQKLDAHLLEEQSAKFIPIPFDTMKVFLKSVTPTTRR